MPTEEQMLKCIKKVLREYLKSGDMFLELAEWVWDELADVCPTFDPAEAEQDEAARILFAKCLFSVLQNVDEFLRKA